MRTASASSARGDLALMSVGASLNGDELTEGLLAADGRGRGPAAPPGRRRSASESFPERLPSRDGSVGTSVGAWAAGFARRGSLDPFAREVVDGEHAAARRAALGGSSQDLAGLGDVEGAAPAAPPGSPAAPPKSRTEVQLLSSFEALDYGPSMSAYRRARRRDRRRAEEDALVAFATLLAVGCIVGTCGFCVARGTTLFQARRRAKIDRRARRLELARYGPSGAVTPGGVARVLAASAGLAVASALLVVGVEAAAAGSGIPEAKAYLNGVNYSRYLALRCGAVKAVAVVLSVASGLHRFRHDAWKREFVACGAAAGVAAAFGSPIGGVAFALEEATTFWDAALTAGLRGGGAATATLWTFEANFGDQPAYDLRDLPLMVLGLGVLGGVVGAAFCHCNVRLSRWRRRRVLGRPARRVAEVGAAALLTAGVMAALPALVGSCRAATPQWACSATENGHYCGDYYGRGARGGAGGNATACAYECWDRSTYERGGCGEGFFDAAATLSMRPSDGAIAALFHDDDVAFGAAALAAYAAAAFALAALTYGVAVPSGLFVPSILIGGALGRLAGEAYRALDLVPGGVHVRPGVWAVCGAAAVLAGAGVTRLTMTITVIVFETTGLSDLAPPLMGVVCVAKTLADALGGPRSIYDAHVALKCIPYLDDESNGDDGDAVVGDVMATAVRCVPDVAPHAAALSCLEDTRHNAFPVLAAGDGAFVGLVSRRELAALLAHVAALAADPRRPRGPAGPAPADAFSSSLQSRVAPLRASSIDEALEEAELRYIEDFPEEFQDDERAPAAVDAPRPERAAPRSKPDADGARRRRSRRRASPDGAGARRSRHWRRPPRRRHRPAAARRASRTRTASASRSRRALRGAERGPASSRARAAPSRGVERGAGKYQSRLLGDRRDAAKFDRPPDERAAPPRRGRRPSGMGPPLNPRQVARIRKRRRDLDVLRSVGRLPAWLDPREGRRELSARAWANVTAAMAPLLHPALRMKWLYNDLDVKFLGLRSTNDATRTPAAASFDDAFTRRSAVAQRRARPCY
ncbi:chloride channel [Aureococcus anophagefferens]|nr:chloride channel [Aureococcus anophagefferens]